jgi:hypothetical protein
MTNSNHALVAVAIAAAVSLTLTAAAAAQASPTTPDTAGPSKLAAQAVAAAPAETRYVLVDVGGKALPVEIDKGWRCREDVTAGTLLLREDGHWRLQMSVREICGDRPEMEHEDDDGTYRAEGTTLHFLDDDGNRNHADWSLGGEIDLDELDQGTMAAGGTLTVRLADEKTVLRFRREGA